MIPAAWREHRRHDDGELLGYIEAVEPGFRARTLFGFPLSEPGAEADPERILDSLGLGYIAERWLLSIPGRDEPITVQIVEATPEAVTVKSIDYGYEADYGTSFTLEVPTQPDQLRPERPL